MVPAVAQVTAWLRVGFLARGTSICHGCSQKKKKEKKERKHVSKLGGSKEDDPGEGGRCHEGTGGVKEPEMKSWLGKKSQP